MRRRTFLAGSGFLAVSSLAGCTALVASEEARTTPPMEFVPSATAVEEYGGRLQERGYTVWHIDIARLGTQVGELPTVGRAAFESAIPVRAGIAHDDIGIGYGTVEEMLLLGVPQVNSFAAGVDAVGTLVATVTIGAFDRDTVAEQLAEAYPRADYGVTPRFIDDEFAYAVGDGWLVAGFGSAVEAVVDARQGRAIRHVDSEPAIDRIASELSSQTFYSATRFDAHDTTDPADGRFAGQIAEGFGYSVDGGKPSLKGTLVFEESAAIDEPAIARWATSELENVVEPSVSVDDRAVSIEGSGEARPLKFSTMAFHPFAYAAGSGPPN